MSHTASIFAHVDAIVTVGEIAVVLDRAQTSVTASGPQGAPQQALRPDSARPTSQPTQSGGCW